MWALTGNECSIMTGGTFWAILQNSLQIATFLTVFLLLLSRPCGMINARGRYLTASHVFALIACPANAIPPVFQLLAITNTMHVTQTSEQMYIVGFCGICVCATSFALMMIMLAWVSVVMSTAIARGQEWKLNLIKQVAFGVIVLYSLLIVGILTLVPINPKLGNTMLTVAGGFQAFVQPWIFLTLRNLLVSGLRKAKDMKSKVPQSDGMDKTDADERAIRLIIYISNRLMISMALTVLGAWRRLGRSQDLSTCPRCLTLRVRSHKTAGVLLYLSADYFVRSAPMRSIGRIILWSVGTTGCLFFIWAYYSTLDKRVKKVNTSHLVGNRGSFHRNSEARNSTASMDGRDLGFNA